MSGWHGSMRTAGLAGLTLAATALADPATAQERRCNFFAATDAEFMGWLDGCATGDVLSAVIAEDLGSPLAYAALVCDFRQQIVIDAILAVQPDTGAQIRAKVLVCVLVGRVRPPAHG